MRKDEFHVYDTQRQQVYSTNAGTLSPPFAAQLKAMRSDLADRRAATPAGEPLPTAMHYLTDNAVRGWTGLDELSPANAHHPHSRHFRDMVAESDGKLGGYLDRYTHTAVSEDYVAGYGLVNRIHQRRSERVRRRAFARLRTAGVLLRAGRNHTTMNNGMLYNTFKTWEAEPSEGAWKRELRDMERAGAPKLAALGRQTHLSPAKRGEQRAVRKMRKYEKEVSHALGERNRLIIDLAKDSDFAARNPASVSSKQKTMYSNSADDLIHAENKIHEGTERILTRATGDTLSGRRRERHINRKLDKAESLQARIAASKYRKDTAPVRKAERDRLRKARDESERHKYAYYYSSEGLANRKQVRHERDEAERAKYAPQSNGKVQKRDARNARREAKWAQQRAENDLPIIHTIDDNTE